MSPALRTRPVHGRPCAWRGVELGLAGGEPCQAQALAACGDCARAFCAAHLLIHRRLIVESILDDSAVHGRAI